MAKLNTPGRASGTGPFATEATSSGKTHESGEGSPVPKSELFLRATTMFAGALVLRGCDLSR